MAVSRCRHSLVWGNLSRNRRGKPRKGLRRSSEIRWTIPATQSGIPLESRGKRVKGARGVATDSVQSQSIAARLGIQTGFTVQELGYDVDVDADLRDSIDEVVGEDFVGDEYQDVVDVVLLWWRDGDGDLVDALVDAIGPLADHGVVWLMTPKPGRDGHVDAEDIADAAPTAGLQPTSTISAGSEWQGTRLVAPRAKR